MSPHLLSLLNSHTIPTCPSVLRRSFSLTFSTTDLKDLNEFLESRSYVVGFKPSATDSALFAALGKAPDAKKFPNVARYYSHIASFGSATFPAALGAGAAATGGAVKAASKPAAEDEDVDLFGDDGEEAAAKVKAAAPAPAAEKKKEKVKPIAKSICVYDVKPMVAETTPAEMEKAIRSITMDGLNWGETFKVEDVGYGIKKLVIQFVCEDEKVSLTDLEDAMLAIKGTLVDEDTGDIMELIQSVRFHHPRAHANTHSTHVISTPTPLLFTFFSLHPLFYSNAFRAGGPAEHEQAGLRKQQRGNDEFINEKVSVSVCREEHPTPISPTWALQLRVCSPCPVLDREQCSLGLEAFLDAEVKGLSLDLHCAQALHGSPNLGRMQRRASPSGAGG